MKKLLSILLAALLSVLAISALSAQTTLINPTGNGGFESGTTFAENGWTRIGTSDNRYQIGTAPVQYAGSR